MGNRREQRTKMALPVRVHTRNQSNQPLIEVACTMDITPKGARLTGVRCVTEVGEVVCIERGKNKAYYRVIWIGDRANGRETHVGLQCIEPEAAIWGVDLLPGQDERYEKDDKNVRGALAEKDQKQRPAAKES